MNKIYYALIIFLAAVAIFYTEKSFADSTTILAPDGTVTICTTGQGIVLCV
jgi:hypothetical protein